MPTVVVSKVDDRIDRICFAFYGTVATRQVERVIDVNPGLEDHPILLPAGIKITLPDLTPDAKTVPIIAQVKLWD